MSEIFSGTECIVISTRDMFEPISRTARSSIQSIRLTEPAQRAVSVLSREQETEETACDEVYMRTLHRTRSYRRNLIDIKKP